MATQGAPEPPKAALSSRREAAIVAASVVCFAAVAWFKAVRLPYPIFDDVEFLDFGNHIRMAGGPLTVLRGLFTGEFTESNRHPLYLALISLIARPEPGFHRAAQVLAVALGVVALLACWWVTRRHAGPVAGAIVAATLAGSGALVWTACRECPDALLVAFWALSVGALLDGADDTGARGRWAWLRAGVWAGLAYETKGPGLFMPICLGITLLARERLRAIRDLRAWAFAVGFGALAAPLWWRNVRVFGSPTYNANGRLFWVDRLPDFAEIFAPHAFDHLPRNAREYLAETTVGHVAWRFGMGLAETIFHLGDALAPVAPRPGSPLHVIWVVLGVVGALVAVWALVRSDPSFARTLGLAQCGFWFVFLVFYNAVSGASRYFLPLTTTAIIPALAAWAAARPRGGGVRAIGAAGGLSLLAVTTTFALDRSPTVAPPGYLEAQAWLVAQLRDGGTYAVDARTHFQPRWLAPEAHQVIVSASWKTAPVAAEELHAYFCENHVRYAVIDGESRTSGVEEGASASRYFFYDRLPLSPAGALPREGFPAFARPVYVGAELPLRWVVLEISCPASPG
jgi:4-amino-4-deoxy-L-arabinose transferase-like glycosyltransferase